MRNEVLGQGWKDLRGLVKTRNMEHPDAASCDDRGGPVASGILA
jgi:hypothetical protein